MSDQEGGGNRSSGRKKRKRKQQLEEDDFVPDGGEEKSVSEPAPKQAAYKSAVDLYSTPMIDSTVKRVNYEEFTQTQTSMSPLIITCTASSHFLDLSDLSLSFVVKFTRGDGNDLALTDQIYPVNNIGHSLIRQMRVTINGNSIEEGSGDDYHIRAYLDRLLQYGVQEKKDNLTIEGWYDDDPGKMDDVNPIPRLAVKFGDTGYTVADGSKISSAEANKLLLALLQDERQSILSNNTGARKRQELCAGKQVRFEIWPPNGMFQTIRYLPPGCEIKFTIYWNDPKMVLMASQDGAMTEAQKNPKFEIIPNTPKVHVKNVQLKEELHVQLEKQMLNSQFMAKYPHMSTTLKTTVVPNGRREHQWSNVFSGKCPNYLVIGLVDGDAYVGSYTKCFYNFQDMGQSHIRITKNGEEIPYQRLNLSGELCDEGFKALLKFTGQNINSPPLGITRETYKKGYYLLLYNFNPDGEQNPYADYARNTANVNIEIDFSRNTTDNTTILALGYFENQGWLDGFKNFTLRHVNS